MKIRILAVGKMKKGPWLDLIHEYKKRCKWPMEIIEIDHSQKSTETKQLLTYLAPEDHLVLLDERGESLTSEKFASYIEKLQVQAIPRLNFLIGGSSGIDASLLQQQHKKIAFGPQTWPHMFVRAMLVEQIYRAESILAGHPYHKD
ncbi:MAG: 23S rRNA (pseudouridine(1915)-N(3))-methyltransferase RlmH [Alphaproteobacteria bacterium]|nr:23S rRNA (pseudouridine(1915)-N(3))-methyltransferase RlmH [Alphaproteobacteria bacterium]